MRRLFGCPDIVSLTEKFLMARNFFRIFTENNPVMGYSKTFFIPEAKGLKTIEAKVKNFFFFLSQRSGISDRHKPTCENLSLGSPHIASDLHVCIFSFLFVVAMKWCPIAAKIAESTGFLPHCFKWPFHIGVRTFAWLVWPPLTTILCVWEICSGSNTC